jgi:putative ribosome biogenesis GTPase RsgA
MVDLLDGLIIKAQSGFFTVRTGGDGDFVCRVRGRLKQEWLDTDLVAVGDRVRISLTGDGTGMIEEVAERERSLVGTGVATFPNGSKSSSLTPTRRSL